MPDLPILLRQIRRALLRRRRLILAILVAAAVVAFAEQVAPPDPPRTSVVVAATDLAAGVTLAGDDLQVRAFPDEVLPSAAVVDPTAMIGETLAGPMRRGEVLTDRRVVSPALLGGYPAGSRAAPVRVADADVVSLLEVGDRLDVYAADPESPDSARLLVADAPVVTIPPIDARAGAGGLVVLAVDSTAASRLAQAVEVSNLSVVLR